MFKLGLRLLKAPILVSHAVTLHHLMTLSKGPWREICGLWLSFAQIQGFYIRLKLIRTRVCQLLGPSALLSAIKKVSYVVDDPQHLSTINF